MPAKTTRRDLLDEIPPHQQASDQAYAWAEKVAQFRAAGDEEYAQAAELNAILWLRVAMRDRAH